jgi:hypothetical protein
MESGPDELENASAEERNELSDEPLDKEGSGPTADEAGSEEDSSEES